MPYTEFHYTPTGTGVISGKEVLEQTEDAINDLGGQISGDVQTAIDTANNALNVANTASSDAQNAVNTANTAYTAATNAQNTANAAQNTASNALTAAQNAQNDVNALGNRVTTAENNISQNTSDISGLTTRMGTAEGNITTLQNDVVTAQGTATSAQNTATMARQQAYVLRYSSTAITDNSTIAYSTLDNTDNVKVSDKIIDSDGKIFSVVSIDSANETVTVGSALIDLALDANVMHLSGDETVAGIKTFSDIPIFETFDGIRFRCVYNSNAYIRFRNANQPNPGSIILNANDGSISTTVHLVDKSFIPYNADVDLGTLSKAWESVSGNLYNSIGTYIGNEASTNQRTNILLMANRDTAGKSGAYITRFRQNRSQGALQPTDLQIIGFDVLENEVRTNNVLSIQCTDWLNNVPQRVNIISDAQSYSYGNSARKALFNDLNPGALSLPDLSNGIDISGYLNTGSSTNDSYTAPADGYLAIIMASHSACGMYVYDYSKGIFMRSSSITDSTYSNVCGIFIPILKNQTMNIASRVTESIVSAKFYPCLGNV